MTVWQRPATLAMYLPDTHVSGITSSSFLRKPGFQQPHGWSSKPPNFQGLDSGLRRNDKQKPTHPHNQYRPRSSTQ